MITTKILIKIIALFTLAFPVTGMYAEIVSCIRKKHGNIIESSIYKAISRCMALMSGVLIFLLIGFRFVFS